MIKQDKMYAKCIEFIYTNNLEEISYMRLYNFLKSINYEVVITKTVVPNYSNDLLKVFQRITGVTIDNFAFHGALEKIGLIQNMNAMYDVLSKAHYDFKNQLKELENERRDKELLQLTKLTTRITIWGVVFGIAAFLSFVLEIYRTFWLNK